MTLNDYRLLKETVIDAGYGDEIDWQANVKPCNDPEVFMGETCWVILNSGMKEQIARKIWDRIKEAWRNGTDISEVFKHKGKVAAIKQVKENYIKMFKDFQDCENIIEHLQTIPFIGKITCYHLAKNLGYDEVKPDRHLVRIAEKTGETPFALCYRLSKESGDRISVVDIIIWRACNLKFI